MERMLYVPKIHNELVKYQLSKENLGLCKLVRIQPIDLRFGYIEGVFRNYSRLEGYFNPGIDEIYGALCCSNEFITSVIRTYIAMHSSSPNLYITNPPANKGSNVWKFTRYSTSNFEKNIEDYICSFTETDQLVVRKYINSILKDILNDNNVKNQVILFDIRDFNIRMYSIGDIYNYRYRELIEDILIPTSENLSSGEYYL